MKTNRDNTRVIIERDDRKLGCLRQGGIMGRVSSYPIGDVMSATGLTSVAAVMITDLDDDAPAYVDVSCGAVILRNLGDGHIVRTGGVIR